MLSQFETKRNAICASMALALCCCDNSRTVAPEGIPEASVEPADANSTNAVPSPENPPVSNSTTRPNLDEAVAKSPQPEPAKPKERKPDYYSLEVEQLVRLTEDENPRAAFILGLTHEWGHQVDRDASSAFKWMSLAAAQSEGITKILFEKELLRLTTPLTETQMEEAGQAAREFWRQKQTDLEKKSQEEDAEARLKLGLIYYRGEGFKPKERAAQLAKHMETARNLFEAASGQGHSGAGELLGMMLTSANSITYRAGEIKRFVDTNKENEPQLLQAWRALDQAAASGSSRAYLDMLELSTHMTPAQLSQVHQETKELLEQKTLLLKEAAKGKDGKPQLRLGLMLYLGKDLAQDQAAAAVWLKKAGAKHSSEASSLLASMHFLGEGVEKSFKETYKWYGISQAQGNAAASTGKTEVAKLLSTEEKTAADAEVKAWLEAHPKP